MVVVLPTPFTPTSMMTAGYSISGTSASLRVSSMTSFKRLMTYSLSFSFSLFASARICSTMSSAVMTEMSAEIKISSNSS